MTKAELEQRIDAVFASTPKKFVEQRNRLAKDLSEGGEKADVARVKSLRKPSVSAWTVNQLFRRQRERVDELLAAGEALQRAQLAVLSGGGQEAMRTAVHREGSAIAQLLEDARRILDDAGLAATAATLARVGTNLRTLARVRSAQAEYRGRLTQDLPPAGVETLMAGQAAARAKVPSGAKPTPSLRTDPRNGLDRLASDKGGRTTEKPISGQDRLEAQRHRRAEEDARKQAYRRLTEARVQLRNSAEERGRMAKRLQRNLARAERDERTAKEHVALLERSLASAREKADHARRETEKRRREVEVAVAEAQAIRRELEELEQKIADLAARR